MTWVLEHDHETFNEVDLKKRGLDIYTRDPSARTLMTSYRLYNDSYEFGDNPSIALWDLANGERYPSDILEALADPSVEKWSFNAAFERLWAMRVLGVDTPYEGWRCSMVLAYMHSFTGGLDSVGEQMLMPLDEQKGKDGKRLINKFCMPQKITKANPHVRRDWNTDPEDWDLFGTYCVGDTRAESGIKRRLLNYPLLQSEWELYELDQRINDRGLPIDRVFVESAIRLADQRKAELIQMMRELTGLTNPNSPTQLLEWLRNEGYDQTDLQKDTIKKALKQAKELENDVFGPAITQAGIQGLKLRQQSARLSVRKYNAILQRVGPDDRIRHVFQMGGASRTIRWAGRGFQPQNLTSTPKQFEVEDGVDDTLRIASDIIRDGDMDGLKLMIEEPMDALAGCVRSSVRVQPGKKLVVTDIASVESVVIGQLCGCTRLLNVFRQGKDAYKDFATEFYQIAYELVTKEQRKICKPPTLGCFGAQTQVLTLSGWKPIVEVRKDDLLFDGVEWVGHDGLVDQGEKIVIDLHGVEVTPEHEVLCGEDWYPAWVVSQSSRFARQAIDSASGKSFPGFATQHAEENSDIYAGVSDVSEKSKSLATILSAAKPEAVYRAQMSVSEANSILSTISSRSEGQKSTASPIGFTLSGHAAKTNHLNDTVAEASGTSSKIAKSSSDIASRSQDGMCGQIRSTELTTPETMHQETSGLYPRPGTIETKKNTGGSSTGEKSCAQPTSMNGSARDTERSQQSVEKSEKVSPRTKSSPIRPTAKVRTFDVANVGPRHRFVVKTDIGPMIVHNCGFGLGGGDLRLGKRTGLWGYAEKMGVEMTRDEAHKAVALWRDTYEEIPVFWYGIEKTIIKVVKDGHARKYGSITVKLLKPYLLLELPSGGHMYYYKPKIATERRMSRWGNEYTKEIFTHMGQEQKTRRWIRMASRGAKIVENLVQRIAREILKTWMLRAVEAGWNIIGHVHDELINEEDENSNYFIPENLIAELRDRPIEWWPDIPLNAAGWSGLYYRKD